MKAINLLNLSLDFQFNYFIIYLFDAILIFYITLILKKLLDKPFKKHSIKKQKDEPPIDIIEHKLRLYHWGFHFKLYKRMFIMMFPLSFIFGLYDGYAVFENISSAIVIGIGQCLFTAVFSYCMALKIFIKKVIKGKSEIKKTIKGDNQIKKILSGKLNLEKSKKLRFNGRD